MFTGPSTYTAKCEALQCRAIYLGVNWTLANLSIVQIDRLEEVKTQEINRNKQHKRIRIIDNEQKS